MTDHIPEPVSKKPKRGRPTKFSDDERQIARFIGQDVKTERGRQNLIYQTRALNALMDRHEFDYIVSSSDEVMAGTGHVRLTILQALGRLEDEDQIREVATVICDKKMLSKKATAFVRRCRGINPVFDLIELGQQVADLVEQYCDTHSGWSYGLILSALESVMETVSLLKREQDDQTNE